MDTSRYKIGAYHALNGNDHSVHEYRMVGGMRIGQVVAIVPGESVTFRAPVTCQHIWIAKKYKLPTQLETYDRIGYGNTVAETDRQVRASFAIQMKWIVEDLARSLPAAFDKVLMAIGSEANR